MSGTYLIISVLVTAVINGIIKSHAGEVRKGVAIALSLLPLYGWLVHFSEDSKRLFGKCLFARAEELSVLADFLPRLIVLAGMPVLSLVMLCAILRFLKEPENGLYRLIRKWSRQGVTSLSFASAATVLVLGLDAIAKGSTDFILHLLHSITPHNCMMVLCMSGMMTLFMYLIFETYVAVSTLPELFRLLRYKPKHSKG